MIFTTMLYYFVALCVMLFSLFVFFPNNPVYAVLALVFNFVSVSFLLFMHGLDFLALSLIIVYVGAIAVLFLFVVMMLDIKEIMPSALENRMLTILCFLTFFISLIFSSNSLTVGIGFLCLGLGFLLVLYPSNMTTALSFNFVNIFLFLGFLGGFFHFFDLASLINTEAFLFQGFNTALYNQQLTCAHSISEDFFQGNFTEATWTTHVDHFYSNVEALGQILYTEYVILFLLIGILLLAAMIGAIVLTLQVNTDGLKQDMSVQLSVSNLKYNRAL